MIRRSSKSMSRATKWTTSQLQLLTLRIPARRAMGSWRFFPCIVYSAFARVRTRYRTAPRKRSLARVVDGRGPRKMTGSADDHADARERVDEPAGPAKWDAAQCIDDLGA